MLSSAGIGSGLDINQIVSDLVAAESVPKNALFDQQEAVLQTELSALGILKSGLSDLQASLAALTQVDTFNARSASSSSSDTFNATATNNAVTGSYGIEVEQLAQAHKLTSDGFTDAATVVGTGTLTLYVGSDSFTLTIDDSNKTVEGIRDAINNAADNTGITATTINVDGVSGTETRLVLTSTETGEDGAITIDATNGGEGNLSQLTYDPIGGPGPGTGNQNLTETDPALNSIIYIDGLAVTSSSNTVTDAIDGVTLNLQNANPGTEHTLTVALNTSTISSAITSMVDAYNEFYSALNSLTSYSEEGASGALIGNSLARGIETFIRQQTTGQVSSVDSTYNSLAAIGITTNEDGTLAINSDTLNTAIESNLDDITNLFSAEDGVATILDSSIENYVEFNGLFDLTTDSLNSSIDDINDQREQFNLRMQSLESRLLAQFIAMDTLVAQLNATGDALTQALASLPEANSINN